MLRSLLLPAVVFSVLLLGPLSRVPGQKKAADPSKGKSVPNLPGYKRMKIQGFTLLVHKSVVENNDDSQWRRKPLDVLDLELGTIGRKLPDKSVKALQRILIWIEWEDTTDPDLEKKVIAKYYGVTGNLSLWSLGKGKHPGKANNIEVINMKRLTQEHQPDIKLERCVMLHELAHAVHHQLLGNNNTAIKSAYKQAMARGLYDEAKDVYGRTHKPTYAAKNDAEYFAELTCAYIDKLHYFPFTPEDLKKHDPVGYKVMEKCWGTRKRLDAALKVKTEKEASSQLAAARKLQTAGKKQAAKAALEKLIDRHPETKAGGEAQKLLEKWKEKES